MKKLGLYIHVPFCLKKCPYCDFYSRVYNEALKDRYVVALKKCIEFYADPSYSVDSIYFGGGTPSLLSISDIDSILQAIGRCFQIYEAEITLEANPSSVSLEKLIGYKTCGINRISFGIQSLNDSELNILGRLHDTDTAKRAVEYAKTAGFKNISADLMLGISRQTADSLISTISGLHELEVDHISAYILSIEEHTPYFKIRDSLNLPDENAAANIYLSACNELERLGYMQYEISNFAKVGFESRHNLKYWQLDEYLGIGPAAHSLFNGCRSYFPEDIGAFFEMQDKNDFSMSAESDFEPSKEFVMLSLRLKKGLELDKAKREYGVDTERILKKAKIYIDGGLAVISDGYLRLTRQGFLVSNSIISDLM